MYGDKVHAAVLAAKENKSGATLHFINEKYDEGPIISRIYVEVVPDDTVRTLADRVQFAEKLQLIRRLRKFAAQQP